MPKVDPLKVKVFPPKGEGTTGFTQPLDVWTNAPDNLAALALASGKLFISTG